MPGNIKKTEGPDPDPAPWLEVSPELKVKLKSKPYDPKKSCWWDYIWIFLGVAFIDCRIIRQVMETSWEIPKISLDENFCMPRTWKVFMSSNLEELYNARF